MSLMTLFFKERIIKNIQRTLTIAWHLKTHMKTSPYSNDDPSQPAITALN